MNKQDKIIRASVIEQPLEGLLYDLDLLPEQCKNVIANFRRIAIEVLLKEIERLKKELLNNIEQLTDIFVCADRITTGNVSHNIKWLKLITNEMIIQNRQALKEGE